MERRLQPSGVLGPAVTADGGVGGSRVSDDNREGVRWHDKDQTEFVFQGRSGGQWV